MNGANVIRKAMSNLPGHWHQGAYTDDNGNYCGFGHIGQALDEAEELEEYERQAMYSTLHAVAKEQYPERTGKRPVTLLTGFPCFNDHPDTTEEDVLRIMDKAAVELESRVDFTSGV